MSVLWRMLVAAANRLPLRAEAVDAGLVRLWAAWALIVPALTATIAVTISPAPSRATLNTDIRHTQTDLLRQFDQWLAALEQRYPRVAGGRGAEALPAIRQAVRQRAHRNSHCAIRYSVS